MAALQVCKLPPAWGFAHAGQARLIASFPLHDSRGRRTRLLREEDDVKMLARRDAREDAWAYAYSAAKLLLSMQAVRHARPHCVFLQAGMAGELACVWPSSMLDWAPPVAWQLFGAHALLHSCRTSILSWH